MYEPDEAERFLLERTQVLCSPPRIPWTDLPGSSTAAGGSTTLVPPALGARDRKASRGLHEPVARPFGFDYHASASGTGAGSSTDQVLEFSRQLERNPLRRIPSPEESHEWRRRKMAAARVARAEEADRLRRRIDSGRGEAGAEVWDVDKLEDEAERRQALLEKRHAQEGKAAGKGKEVIHIADDADEAEVEDNAEMCVICLQGVRDRTVLGECGHQSFCFECINVWSNQSRRCPLCSAAMSPFLLHKIDDPAGPQKFHLPPLPSIRPSQHTTFSSQLATRPAVPPFRQRGPEVLLSERERWGRPADRGGESAEDVLERQVERRREIYRYGLFTKHIASNMHTRYKPIPTPRQFADNPDMIARATGFLRRELRVWRGIDVEFLTAYIISLMRSIDIRSEPAVRLLADFLDEPGLTGRDRRGAEHFAHEVYSFLRSPYRDLAVYDAVAQYDPVPEEEEPVWTNGTGADEVAHRRLSANGERPAASPRAPSPARSRSPSVRGRSRSRSLSRSSRFSSRSPSPVRERPPRSSPRRWDKRDSYIAPPSPRSAPLNVAARGDSWVDPEIAAAEAEAVRRRQARRDKAERKREARLARRGMGGLEKRRDEPPHRGLRGWGEAEDAPPEVQKLQSDDVEQIAHPDGLDGREQVAESSNIGKPLRLRIFGAAKPGPTANDVPHGEPLITPSPPPVDREALSRQLPPAEELTIAAPRSPAAISDYEEDPWGVEPDLGDAYYPQTTALSAAPSAGSSEEEAARIARLKALQREKLLGKLVREKRISAKARAIVNARSKAARAAAAHPATEVDGHADSSPLQAIPVQNGSAQQKEPDLAAKTRELKLKLKLKLAKEKARGEAASAASTATAPPPEDRAAMLRARLMAAKAKG